MTNPEIRIPTVARATTPGRAAKHARYWRAHGRQDVAERIEADLKAAGRCRVCGRELTDPASIKAGIGPDCAQRQRPPPG